MNRSAILAERQEDASGSKSLELVVNSHREAKEGWSDARPTFRRVEQHYTPSQVAVRLGLSPTKVRRMFQDEPGVVKIGEPSRRLGRALKRRYFTLRIPESAVVRVLERCRNR